MRSNLKASWTAAALLLVAVSLGIYFSRNPFTEEDRIFVPPQVAVSPEARLLQQYVQIDTSNPPGNERAGARWLAEQLHRNGIESEIVTSAPGRDNVYARIRGTAGGGGLLLLNHIDVVPASREGWTYPPFAGQIRIAMLWGRGALDMKSIAICELEAFIALAKSGVRPLHDVVFLATSDEEQGSASGMVWLLEHRPDVFSKLTWAITEGGLTETIRDRPSVIQIEVGAKASVKMEVVGETLESVRNARIALEPYGESFEPQTILPVVAASMRNQANGQKENSQLFTDLADTWRRGKFWLIPQGLRELTCNIVLAGGAHRSGKAWAMDVYTFDLPGQNAIERVAWVERFLEPYHVRVRTVLRTYETSPISRTDLPEYTLLSNELHRHYPNAAVGPMLGNGTATDCRFLRPRGIPCYGLFPFPTNVFQTQGIHHKDERIRLDWFQEGIAFTKDLVRDASSRR